MALTPPDQLTGSKLLESAVFFTAGVSGDRTQDAAEQALQAAAAGYRIDPAAVDAAVTELEQPGSRTEAAARLLLAAATAAGRGQEVGTAVQGSGRRLGTLDIGHVSRAIVRGLFIVLETDGGRRAVLELDRDNGLVYLQDAEAPLSIGGPLASLIAPVLAAPRNKDVADVLGEMKEIVLSQCVVVGKYLRHHEQTRNDLKLWVDRIGTPLQTKNKLRENYLIWAASGSGKTFLIQQIAAELKVEFAECNLAKPDIDKVKRAVGRLTAPGGPVLCLLDEIDAFEGHDWPPYGTCLPLLEQNDTRDDRQVVTVLVGSHRAGMDSMVKAISQRDKGPDLLSRVPQADKVFTIPPTTPADDATMAGGQILSSLGVSSVRVEKLALFYLLCHDALKGKPRQLTEFIKGAVHRGAGGGQICVHDLFRPDEAHDKLYSLRKENEQAVEKLRNVFVEVSN